MRVQQVVLKNFRCFPARTIQTDKQFVVIEGTNGSGKTSLLEALTYACYLRSFRTRRGRELISFENDHFFVRVTFADKHGEPHDIAIGYAGKEKTVKLDERTISSYKELLSLYRVISLTEEDLALVSGAPEVRRAFLDQSLFLHDPAYLTELKEFRQILFQRNSLILKKGPQLHAAHEELVTWTRQLWGATQRLAHKRRAFLEELEGQTNILLADSFSFLPDVTIEFEYRQKYDTTQESFETFWHKYAPAYLEQEIRFGRSLMGAHLDDFHIHFRKKQARVYASRGQQKLVVFIIKLAKMRELAQSGIDACLLLDDFLTDLDKQVFEECVQMIHHQEFQVFITTPLTGFITEAHFPPEKLQIISLER